MLIILIIKLKHIYLYKIIIYNNKTEIKYQINEMTTKFILQ